MARRTFLHPTVVIEKVADDRWDALWCGTMQDWLAGKTGSCIGSFVKDVDGDWLFFFDGNGGYNRHTMSEVSAAFNRFLPDNGGPHNGDTVDIRS